jgi:uncharacterized membrane protein YbhN (UPF0104 family)
MSDATVTTRTAPPEAARRHGGRRIAIIVAGVVVGGALASLLGWDIRGWFASLWDTLTSISAGHVVWAVVALTVQTTATAYAWYTILCYAYPREVRFLPVFAAYSANVALNDLLPANLGTIVMFVMLTTVIASATFVGVVSGFLVEKIFFTAAGIFVYVYLFLTVPGSFDISFSWVRENPWATAGLLVGGAGLIFLVLRSLWPKVLSRWEHAKAGARILTRPGAYLGRVVLPELVAWIANLVVIAIFLSAYAIPVTFHTVMSVVGGNSIANTTSVTPGGVGVTQAFNVAALGGVTDAQTATAYSIGQQLVSTAWHLVMGIVLVVWAFGWGGGKTLVRQSYVEAKESAAEQKAARKGRRSPAHGRSAAPENVDGGEHEQRDARAEDRGREDVEEPVHLEVGPAPRHAGGSGGGE